jgi:endonuclease VIII
MPASIALTNVAPLCGQRLLGRGLFRHGLDPQLPGRKLTRACWDELWVDLVDLLHDGFRRGKIETLRSEHDPRLVDGVGPCARATYVYKRTGEPCLVCGTPVAHARHLARNLFWCPVCQAPEPVRPARRAARRMTKRLERR